jgi:hypothetical protein
MKKDKVTINLEEWKVMYAIQCKMELYFKYKSDCREVIAALAPSFLKDVQKLLKEIE